MRAFKRSSEDHADHWQVFFSWNFSAFKVIIVHAHNFIVLVQKVVLVQNWLVFGGELTVPFIISDQI